MARVAVPATASASYPGFVHWIVNNNRWDVGVAPLLDTPFNRCKSSIKTMDYAGLGLAVLASDVSVYRGSTADEGGGFLVPESTDAWFEAFSRLVRDSRLVARLREASRAAFAAHTLHAQAAERRRAWADVVRREVPHPARRAAAA
jgi:glycosyltransferase involved in cell wall biosynthesis